MTRLRRWWNRYLIWVKLRLSFVVWMSPFPEKGIKMQWLDGNPRDPIWQEHISRWNHLPMFVFDRAPYLAVYDGQLQWLTDEVSAAERMRIVADVAALKGQA